MDAQQEAAYNLQVNGFNLKDELSKINCSKYYDPLCKLGYSDMVGECTACCTCQSVFFDN